MNALTDLHIAVFAKPLVPGVVKTRLIPSLGAEGAAAVQRAMLWKTLTVAREVAGRRMSLWVAGDPDHPTLQPYRDAFSPVMCTQQGRDLGARMRSAMTRLLPVSSRVLLIGCDCPPLSADNVREAAGQLDEPDTDAVFIPVEDGGYALVGLSPRPGWRQTALTAVFDGIPWSTHRVMSRTRTQLAGAGLRWVEQPMLWDLDRPEDVGRAKADGLLQGWLPGDE